MTWQKFLYGGDIVVALKWLLVYGIVWYILDDTHRKMNGRPK